jgi:threonine dehydrogenase-like Zn-dependent dehydrogenase
MSEMLAVRAHADTDHLVIEHIPVPEPGPDEVLVRVAAAGLAPGMLNLLAAGAFRYLPTVLGHEVAGEIAAVGSEVRGWEPGDRVRVHPNLNCRTCRYCTTDRDQMCAQQAMIGHAAFGRVPMPLYERYHNGGLAEFLSVPQHLLDPLPDGVSFEVGAKVHDLANAVRALKCAQLPLGSTVVVTAVTGTMGTATIKLAEHFGIARLILVARSRERLEAVRPLAGSVPTEVVALEELGPGWAEDQGLTRALRELDPSGADAVIDYIPEGQASWQALAAMATGGTWVHMGASTATPPIPARVIMRNCWRLVGTRACSRADARQVLDLLGRRALDVEELITHRFPLKDTNIAVTALMNRTEPIWMAVVTP